MSPTPYALIWACAFAMTVGFDIEAHDAQGQTAASAMGSAATKQVKRLLGGQDASDVAGWGHQVDDTFPGMERLHFQVHDDSAQPFCGPAESRVAKCEDNICLLTAIKHFYGKVLSDEGRKIDFPSIDYDKASKGIKFTDADAVKMLINLIGDLHQPMHVGFAGDNSGKNVKVKLQGKEMSLYDFWDKGISELVRTQESSFWLGGFTHIRAVTDEYEKDKKLWKEDGAFKSFDRWLGEAVSFACKEAYVHPTSKKNLAGPGAETQPIEIDATAYEAWKQLWLKQLLIAGERTAIVLNDILESKDASKLAEGSKVKTKADEEKAKEMKELAKERVAAAKATKSVHSGGFSGSVFLTNLSIACVVVPLFLFIVNFGLSPKVCMEMLRNMMEESQAANSGPGVSRNTKRTE